MKHPEMPESVHRALDELKQAFSRLYGERLHGIYLYGSFARGTAHEGSDVDVLVVLEGSVRPGAEISYMNPVVSEICLRYDLLISTCPVSAEGFETRRSMFLENVRKEALPL